MASRMGLIGCFVIVVALLNQVTIASVEYEVGDSFGWAAPPSTSYYSTWASTKTFYLGDSFFFKWTGNQSVVPVPKPYYDNCTKEGHTYSASPLTFTPLYTGFTTTSAPLTTTNQKERGSSFQMQTGNQSVVPVPKPYYDKGCTKEGQNLGTARPAYRGLTGFTTTSAPLTTTGSKEREKVAITLRGDRDTLQMTEGERGLSKELYTREERTSPSTACSIAKLIYNFLVSIVHMFSSLWILTAISDGHLEARPDNNT
ncbi:Umecyanin [Morella rubra]|uniref:Umecyanin n=1 Tax=Morella rubra TaxID=262757 RepID=A0A6A1UGK9_9ROSI|nr:Umecyanin [Morella rubra]